MDSRFQLPTSFASWRIPTPNPIIGAMSKGRGRRSKWQWFFIGLALIGFVLILLTGRAVIVDTIEILKSVDVRILILLPILQFVAYLFIGGYYKSALSIFNHEVPYLRAYGTVVSLYFVEQVLPSGGVSGMSYIAYALRTVASVGLTTIVQISRYLLNFGAYLLIVPIGLVFLFRDESISDTALWLGVALFVGLLLGAALVRYLLDTQSHIDKLVRLISGFVNKIGEMIFKKKELIKGDVLKKNLKDFHEGARELLRNRSKIMRPYLFMVGASSVQLTIVYLSYLAVGETLNPGIVIVAFTLANVVGAISIIPGDVGVHEAAMIFVLSSAGVDTAVAISGTLLYRVFNKLIVLPIGFFVYTQYLKPSKIADGK